MSMQHKIEYTRHEFQVNFMRISSRTNLHKVCTEFVRTFQEFGPSENRRTNLKHLLKSLKNYLNRYE